MKPAPPLPTTIMSSPETVEASSFNAFPAGRPILHNSGLLDHPSDTSSTHSVRIRPGTPLSAHQKGVSSPSSPRKSSFVGTVHDPDSFVPPLGKISKVGLWWNKTSSFFISSTFLVLVVLWASCIRIAAVIPKLFSGPKLHVYAWDNTDKMKREKVVKDVQHYARDCGFDIIDEEVETADGFLLR